MDKILGWIEKLATGKRSRTFWAVVLVLIVGVVMIYPYVDANFLCYDRIEKRLNNLEKLAIISGQTIYENEDLKAEYDSIITEIEDSRSKHISFNTSKEETKKDYWIKVVGAGFVWYVMAFVALFSKEKKQKLTLRVFLTKKLFVFIVCIFMGLVLGWLFSQIPVIISSWINAIIYVVVEIMILYLIMTPKKEKTNT